MQAKNTFIRSLEGLLASGMPISADSDEVTRVFQDDVARYFDMMSPGSAASQAD